MGASETACPFCRVALPRQRPQRAIPGGRLTRAAIFSAALVACESKQTQPRPTPAPVPAQGSDDLEKMLDGDQRVVDRPTPIDAAASPDATAIAATVDAGVPGDAGTQLADKERRRKMIEHQQQLQKQRERREKEERQRIEQQLDQQRIDNMRIHAKPYGAPPARRRVV